MVPTIEPAEPAIAQAGRRPPFRRFGVLPGVPLGGSSNRPHVHGAREPNRRERCERLSGRGLAAVSKLMPRSPLMKRFKTDWLTRLPGWSGVV